MFLTQIADLKIPARRHRTSPRAVKRGRHNHYRIKNPDEPATIRHPGPPTLTIHQIRPRAA